MPDDSMRLEIEALYTPRELTADERAMLRPGIRDEVTATVATYRMRVPCAGRLCRPGHNDLVFKAGDELNLRVDRVHVAGAAASTLQIEPFVVKQYTGDEGPTIKGNGFDGLRIGDDRAEAEDFVRWVNTALTAEQQGGGEVLARGWLHRRGPGDDYDVHDEESGAGDDCVGCVPCVIVRADIAPASAPVDTARPPSVPAGVPPALTSEQAHELAPAGFSWDEAGAWAMGYEACRQAALSQQPAHPPGTPMMPPGKFHNTLWKSLPAGTQHHARMLTQSWAVADSTELKNALEAAVLALAQQPEPKPEARGVVEEVRSERAWPAIGNLYLVKIGGVLQHEVFMFDQGDCEPGGSAPPFWSRDGLDDCPEFDPHKDQWISLDEIDAALTGERNG